MGSEWGRLGAALRNKKLTPQRRREIAVKASKAAAESMTPKQRKDRARLAGRASARKKAKGAENSS